MHSISFYFKYTIIINGRCAAFNLLFLIKQHIMYLYYNNNESKNQCVMMIIQNERAILGLFKLINVKEQRELDFLLIKR